MDDNGFASEFLTTEFGPDESKNNTHEENHDGRRRVCDGRGDSGRRCERERDTISSVGSDAEGEIKREWAENAFVFFDDAAIVAEPFAIWIDDKKVHNAFA